MRGTMRLIKFSKREDYGTDWYVQVLYSKSWAVFQGCLSWCEFPGWPYLQIRFGMGSMLDIIFSVYKFGLNFGFFERTWNWGDFLEDIDWGDEEETS